MVSADVNVIHLVGSDVSSGRLAGLAELCARTDLVASQRVVQVGPGSLRFPDQVSPILVRGPSGRTWWPYGDELHWHEDITQAQPELPLILHAWSREAVDWTSSQAERVRAVLLEVEPGDERDVLARQPLAYAQAEQLSLVCRTEAVRRRLERAGAMADECVLIRDFVDAGELERARGSNARQRLGLEPTQTVVMVLPPASRRTGTFLAAWATLLLEKVRPDVRLLIPGGGREEQRVRRLVRSSRHEHMARFAGAEWSLAELVTAADLAVYLPDGDAPVDGLAWAMAAGRPIVASDVPAVTEFLRHEQNAWLCRPDSPAVVAGLMLRAMEMPEESQRYAAAARTAALELFDRHRMIAQYAELYAKLASGRPSGPDAKSPCAILHQTEPARPRAGPVNRAGDGPALSQNCAR
jgi:glycosyltransferase involved in cell wall biosynthesis